MLTACGIETCLFRILFTIIKHPVATVLTACGMRRRVRGSREAKRRWGPHISSPWPKGRENKGDEVTVPTACGIETYHLWYYRREVQTAVATVLTACGIETRAILNVPSFLSCNSAYRLRYWNSWYSLTSQSCTPSCCNSAYRLRYWNAGKMIILW